MSFRGRLLVFFTIIVIVPMVAVAFVLFTLSEQSETGKADAGIAAGLRNAISLYGDAGDRAAPVLGRVSRDRSCAPRLRTTAGPTSSPHGRADAHGPRGVVSIELYSSRERLIARAGSPAGVAVKVAPLVARGGDAGSLAVSVTHARAYVRAPQATVRPGGERGARRSHGGVHGVRARPRAHRPRGPSELRARRGRLPRWRAAGDRGPRRGGGRGGLRELVRARQRRLRQPQGDLRDPARVLRAGARVVGVRVPRAPGPDPEVPERGAAAGTRRLRASRARERAGRVLQLGREFNSMSEQLAGRSTRSSASAGSWRRRSGASATPSPPALTVRAWWSWRPARRSTPARPTPAACCRSTAGCSGGSRSAIRTRSWTPPWRRRSGRPSGCGPMSAPELLEQVDPDAPPPVQRRASARARRAATSRWPCRCAPRIGARSATRTSGRDLDRPVARAPAAAFRRERDRADSVLCRAADADSERRRHRQRVRRGLPCPQRWRGAGPAARHPCQHALAARGRSGPGVKASPLRRLQGGVQLLVRIADRDPPEFCDGAAARRRRRPPTVFAFFVGPAPPRPDRQGQWRGRRRRAGSSPPAPCACARPRQSSRRAARTCC